VEPDWRRLPDIRRHERGVGNALWAAPPHGKELEGLKDAFGDLIPDALMASLERDGQERATMSILVPPHMLNTMDEKDLWNDPVRRYMLPALTTAPRMAQPSEGEPRLPARIGYVGCGGVDSSLSHESAGGNAFHLPSYCGHCTRMDLVGTTCRK